jgi:hypothetical protein
MPNLERDRALEPAELREARTALAAARGKRRLDIILDARDPQALVRALPADELYLTIRDIGLADAAPLVPLASAAQFKVFLDLEAWTKEGFEPRRVLPWLRAARSGAHLDPRAAARWARSPACCTGAAPCSCSCSSPRRSSGSGWCTWGRWPPWSGRASTPSTTSP